MDLSSRSVAIDRAILVVGLALFAALALLASPQKSAAFDEQYHLAAGYAYLRTGDYRLATNHPPLMGMIAGLALLPRHDVNLPLDHAAWQTADRYRFSDVWLWESNDQGPALVVQSRIPIVLVGMLLLLGIYGWARQTVGRWGAWLALALAVLDPNLVANSRVVTTDLGLTCFLFLACWRLWVWLTGGSRANIVLAGLCAGLAMGAKYTGLLFWPVALLVVLVHPRRSEGDGPLQRASGLAAMGLTAYAVLWAIYRFDTSSVTLGSLHMTLPAGAYFQQLLRTFERIVDPAHPHLVYLLDQVSEVGSWYYLPVAAAVKIPLPTWLLVVWGSVVALRSEGLRRLSALWAVPLAFVTLGLTAYLTIGFRHILPIVPFLLVLAGYATRPMQLPHRAGVVAKIVCAGCVAWLVVNTWRIYPHQEAFFNELAGSWTNWSRILVDSNLDWGQDLPALKRVMDEQGIDVVNLAYFGNAVPERYGVRYRPLHSYLRQIDGIELDAYNPYTPEPGWYAISATSLRLGLLEPTTVDLYAYFRDLTPTAHAGYSIYLYQVGYPDAMPVDRPVIAGVPVSALSPAELGVTPGRRTQVKWRRGAEIEVYPLGNGTGPQPSSYSPLEADFAGVLTLEGYEWENRRVAPGDTLHLNFYWRVGDESMPMPAPTRGAPLSFFLHMTGDEASQIVAQYDGWPIALRGLEPGDIIVHPVTVDLPDDLPPGAYTLLAGLYSPQNGARLVVTTPSDGQAGAGDHVLIGQVDVQTD